MVNNPVQAMEDVTAALHKSGLESFLLEQVDPTLEDVFVALAGEAA